MTQQEVSERRVALEKRWGYILFDRWQQMAWFVALANTNLAACSEGDIKNLQDACEAIRMVPLALSPGPTAVGRKQYHASSGGTGSSTPTPDVVRRIHDAIQPKLNALADHKEAWFIGGSMVPSIHFYPMDKSQPRAESALYIISSSAESTDYGDDVWPQEFVLRCGQLSATFHAGRYLGDAIRRCPHCTNVFLQLRKNATYCGPACYSVVGMRKLREKQRAQKELKLKRTTRKKGVRR